LQNPSEAMNFGKGLASKGLYFRNIMAKLDKDLQSWLWFFTSAAVVVTAGLAKVKLGDYFKNR